MGSQGRERDMMRWIKFLAFGCLVGSGIIFILEDTLPLGIWTIAIGSIAFGTEIGRR